MTADERPANPAVCDLCGKSLVMHDCVALEAELAYLEEHSDDWIHKELDRANVRKSRIQPSGPATDGAVIRIGYLAEERDALKVRADKAEARVRKLEAKVVPVASSADGKFARDARVSGVETRRKKANP